jgi:hypothetical protein
VTDTAGSAADPAAEQAADQAMSEALTLEGFDYETVTTMIADSDLSQTQKTVLTSALDAAKDSPAMLKAALDQVKAALNL